MSKLATMVGLIINSEKKPPSYHHRHQTRSLTPEKLRPPPGSRNYSSLSRSRSVTVGSASSHPISKSKATKLVVDSLQQRNPQPEAAGVPRRNKSVRSRGKKSSKLRSIISVVFSGHRRRRSSSLSSITTLSSSSRASTRLRTLMRKHDSNSNCEDDEIRGKYSNLSLSSSSGSSTASIGGRKGRKKNRQISRGITVNSANCGGSLRINGIEERMKREERFELCKLKILMGRKCKPLNASGKLRYDEDGVLVPDPLPP